ncbi:MAG: pitrilysin family protein [bacterium]
MNSHTTKTTHKSGIRLVTHNIPDTPSVYISIFVHTGSRFETADNAGIAHFFEHMVFKGTTKRPSPHQIFYDLEMIGAEANAVTSQEFTAYFIKVLKQNLESGFEILSDAFLHSLFIEEEVDKERGVIKEEIKMYEDDPSEYATDQLVENLYPNDQYGRNIAGTIDGMNKLNGQMIKDFYKSHYFAENTVIVAAGDITHSQLEELIDRYFSEYPHGEYHEPEFTPEPFTSSEMVYTKDVQQAQLRMATYSVPFSDPDRYKISVATSVLGSGAGSRLFIEVREKLGLAYNIYAYNNHWSQSGYVAIDAGLMPDKIETVKNIVLKEIKNLSDGDFTDNDLHRAKELYKASLLMNMDTTDSWTWFLGKYECLYGNMYTIDEVIKGIDDVTRDDIISVMSKLAVSNWHTTVVKGGSEN